MTEVLTVTPAPSPEELDALRSRLSAAQVEIQRGFDARGEARLRLALTHPHPERLARAREDWLAALWEGGHRAFVV